MKPCNCFGKYDCEKLEARAIAFDDGTIRVDSTGVILAIDPHFRCKFSHQTFAEFVKWYLEDQDEL